MRMKMTSEEKRKKEHCIECKNFKPIKAKNKCQNCWHKFKKKNSPHFYLRFKYSEIKKRCTNPRELIKNPNYKNKLNIDINTFYKLFINNEQYLNLYKKWQDSGFQYKLSPSIDRIDNNLPYQLGNLQFITHSENCIKDQEKTAIKCYDKNGNYIQTFVSQGEAERKLKLQQANIWKVLNGQRKHTMGYIFKYD